MDVAYFIRCTAGGGGWGTTHQDGHAELFEVTACVSLCTMMEEETPNVMQPTGFQSHYMNGSG